MSLKQLKKPAKTMLGFRLPNRKQRFVSDDLLVVIFLRGGADGLSVVAPYADDGYYGNRVLTSIPSPKSGDTKHLIDLDGFYGLHPALATLYPLYDKGELAIVHACGSGDVTLSHFAASNTVERGLFQGEGEATGWLARYLDALPTSSNTPMKAVSIGSLLPASLQGASCAISLQSIADLLIKSPFTSGDAAVLGKLRRMYGDREDLVLEAGHQTLMLMNILRNSPDIKAAQSTDYSHDDFGNGLKQIASLAKCGTGLAVACIDQSGYDTHVVQGNTVGVLANCLDSLGRSIKSFVDDIGPERWRNTKMIVMSEFGRRVRENDGAGTDHGHGNMMMVLGGKNVRGGVVHGQWLGLNSKGLDQNGNLKTITDYRNVLLEAISGQIGMVKALPIFPDLSYNRVGVING
jgi:uncharacterized protein (DUF1501 family)